MLKIREILLRAGTIRRFAPCDQCSLAHKRYYKDKNSGYRSGDMQYFRGKTSYLDNPEGLQNPSKGAVKRLGSNNSSRKPYKDTPPPHLYPVVVYHDARRKSSWSENRTEGSFLCLECSKKFANINLLPRNLEFIEFITRRDQKPSPSDMVSSHPVIRAVARRCRDGG